MMEAFLLMQVIMMEVDRAFYEVYWKRYVYIQ